LVEAADQPMAAVMIKKALQNSNVKNTVLLIPKTAKKLSSCAWFPKKNKNTLIAYIMKNDKYQM